MKYQHIQRIFKNPFYINWKKHYLSLIHISADVVSLALPGVTGGSAVVKAVSKADDVVDTVKTANKVDNAIDTAKTAKKGWKVGDDVATLTKAGNSPTWSTVRRRHWKNEAFYNPSKYSNNLDNLNRMKRGLAPIGNDGFPIELHHRFGRKGANFYIFEPLTRTDHMFTHYGR